MEARKTDIELIQENTYRFVLRMFGKGHFIDEMERAIYNPDGELIYSERFHWKKANVKTPLRRLEMWLEREESGYNRGYVPGYTRYPLREAWRRFAILFSEFFKYNILRLKLFGIRLKYLTLKYNLSTFHHITTFRNKVEDFWSKGNPDVVGTDTGPKDETIGKEPGK